jgi:hypothetical protein
MKKSWTNAGQDEVSPFACCGRFRTQLALAVEGCESWWTSLEFGLRCLPVP